MPYELGDEIREAVSSAAPSTRPSLSSLLARRRQRRARHAAVVLMPALVLTGGTFVVASLGERPTGAPAPSAQAPTPASQAVLNTFGDYSPDEAAGMRSLGGGSGASELEHFNNLLEARDAATVVVAGRLEGVASKRVIGDPANGGLVYTAYHLQVDEVLAGDRRAAGQRLLFEVAGTPGPLPSGRYVWLLRNKADVPSGGNDSEAPYYRLVSRDGLFMQGERSVNNPLDDLDTPGLAKDGQPAPQPRRVSGPVAEGEQFKRLDELARHLRG